MYKAYSIHNFNTIPQVNDFLSKAERKSIEIVGNVLPFKVNNYVIDNLIDWRNIPEDPIFQLTFPQKEMLSDAHFKKMETAIHSGLDKHKVKPVADNIRIQLNPHPSAQMDNIPEIDGMRLPGIQHKYKETVLFFPSSCQTCHAYCTFCFRWPQFVGMEGLKFAMKETEWLIKYLKHHNEVTDVLFTGGDPMIMSAKKMSSYIKPLIKQRIPNLQTIRIGTKSLSYWPYRFISDKDSDEMLRLFEYIVDQGYHLAFMAHFSHPRELETPAVKKAIKRILNTGALIRTQSPVMRHINDTWKTWKELWREQVKLGCIPYYMFVARNTGSQGYFAIPLEKTYRIFRKAYQKISGIVRTARGPIMSGEPGKVQILGISEIMGREVFTLQFIQGRNPDWAAEPFFAKYDENAIWLDELKPAFNDDRFFFEEELENAPYEYELE
jgi:KamA family protein